MWFVLPLAIVAVIAYVVLTLVRVRTRAADGISPASPLPAALTAVAPPGWQLPEQILNERLATGEESVEEYTQRLAALRQHRADGPSAAEASASAAPAGV